MLNIFKKFGYQKIKKQKAGLEKSMEQIIKDSVEEAIDTSFFYLRESMDSYQEELFVKLQKRINKQNTMLEEMIELTEENKGEKEAIEKRLGQEQQEKKGLLDLLLHYQEYMDLITPYLEGSNRGQADFIQWKSQLDMVYSDLENRMSLIGMEKISATGFKVNTGLHNIIQIVETEDSLLHETVQKILVPGCVYHGEVIRKAKVVANIYKG